MRRTISINFAKTLRRVRPFRFPGFIGNIRNHKVITTEEIIGIRMSDYLTQPHSGEEKKAVAANGANAILQQIFIDGFFHADPHPGNLFILPDNAAAFVDFGIVGRLDEDTRDVVVNLLIAVSTKNINGILKALEMLGSVAEENSLRDFKHDISDFVERFYDIPLKQIEISTILPQAVELMTRHKLKIPPQFHVMIKAIVTMDGVARQLDPDFNTIAHTRPFVERLVHERHDPKRIFKDVAIYSSELLEILKVIPKDTYEIIKR